MWCGGQVGVQVGCGPNPWAVCGVCSVCVGRCVPKVCVCVCVARCVCVCVCGVVCVCVNVCVCARGVGWGVWCGSGWGVGCGWCAGEVCGAGCVAMCGVWVRVRVWEGPPRGVRGAAENGTSLCQCGSCGPCAGQRVVPRKQCAVVGVPGNPNQVGKGSGCGVNCGVAVGGACRVWWGGQWAQCPPVRVVGPGCQWWG